MRKVQLSGEEGSRRLSCYYDSITKHKDSGGITGLKKITKICDLFDAIGTLDTDTDRYALKNDTDTFILQLEEEQFNFIKENFNKVDWHPMRHKLITDAYDYLSAVTEEKPQLKIEK